RLQFLPLRFAIRDARLQLRDSLLQSIGRALTFLPLRVVTFSFFARGRRRLGFWDLACPERSRGGFGSWRGSARVFLAPEKFRVGPRIDDRFAVPDFDDLGR